MTRTRTVIERHNRRVWIQRIGRRGWYVRGRSRAQSRLVWKTLSDARRDVNQWLREALVVSEALL